jgi:3-deoxy-manno-octulosonate cytidylyltransferase (CMP-KDO synthetase)
MANPIILIPARMQATRLPGKPLLDIGGKPMIEHVWRRACEAKLGPVLVATDSPEIAAAIKAAGGDAVLTRDDHQSGSDRIAEALGKADPDARHDIVINVQGDLPTLDLGVIRACHDALGAGAAIGTCAVEISRPYETVDPNVVKVVGSPRGERMLRALYFTRASAPFGPGPYYHHIGLYAYRREALQRFVELPPSPLEKREKLEQLRALEAGMTIDVAIVDTLPLGVDTEHDLQRAREIMKKAGNSA